MTRSRRVPAPRPLPPAAFVDRVMAAVRLETPPTPARGLIAALRRRSLADAGSALAVAWHLATVRAWQVAPSVRARSMALVLAVALALITGSLAAAGAVRLASDPVTGLFQARVDDRGPLEIPPAILNESGNLGPDANDNEDEVEPAGDDAESVDDQQSDDRDEADDPAGAVDNDHDRDDEAEETTDDDSADAEESTDAEEADNDEAEPEEDVDEAKTDEADSDEPDVDEPDADEVDADDGGESSDGEASDDSGSGSESDN